MAAPANAQRAPGTVLAAGPVRVEDARVEFRVPEGWEAVAAGNPRVFAIRPSGGSKRLDLVVGVRFGRGSRSFLYYPDTLEALAWDRTLEACNADGEDNTEPESPGGLEIQPDSLIRIRHFATAQGLKAVEYSVRVATRRWVERDDEQNARSVDTLHTEHTESLEPRHLRLETEDTSVSAPGWIVDLGMVGGSRWILIEPACGSAPIESAIKAGRALVNSVHSY